MISTMPKENLVSPLKYLTFVIILFFILITYLINIYRSPFVQFTCKNNISCFDLNSFNESKPTSLSRTLVIYVYAKTHPSAEENLVFFIRTAVRSSHDADYYFILQQIDNTYFDVKNLPTLPSNAHYIQHENKCFDLGTIGWFLSNGTIDKTKYKYFLFLNSSIRGPFIVAYYDRSIWYTIFTQRLNELIKLVGCTINCENTPHVQSYLWTMDFKTLDFLLKNNTVFVCYQTKTDVINKAEIRASQILLHSSFGIASLMRKYHDVDFRMNVTEICSNNLNPVFDKGGGGGITLDPYEVVFVKTKDGTAPYHDNFERVRVYGKWMH